MKSMGRARRALAVERLEERVVMAVNGYLAGYVYSTPGSLLTIPGTYDPSVQQAVRFVTRTGATYSEQPIAVTPTSVTAAVPLILNPTTLRPINLGVHVVVQQQGSTGAGTKAIYHLQSTPTSSGLRPPGLGSQVALANAQQALFKAEVAYAKIALNNSATAAGSLAFDTDAVRVASSNLQAALVPLFRGKVSSLAAGTVSVPSLPLTLTRGTLGLLDSSLVQASKGPASPFSTRPDLVTGVTNGALGQIDQATQNATSIAPGQLFGANLVVGYAALGQTIAQITAIAGVEGQVSSLVTDAVANPANRQADFAAASAAVNTLDTSLTAQSFLNEQTAYANTIFAPVFTAVMTAGLNIGTDLANLESQLPPA